MIYYGVGAGKEKGGFKKVLSYVRGFTGYLGPAIFKLRLFTPLVRH